MAATAHPETYDCIVVGSGMVGQTSQTPARIGLRAVPQRACSVPLGSKHRFFSNSGRPRFNSEQNERVRTTHDLVRQEMGGHQTSSLESMPTMARPDCVTSKHRIDQDPAGYVLPRGDFREKVRVLSKIDSFRGLCGVFSQWAIILTAASIAIVVDHWLGFLFAIVVIGTRQHALGVCIHEAVHYRLCSNRTANDCVSDLLCAFWLNITTSRYLHHHILHHRSVNTAEDPDLLLMKTDPDLWQWPKRPLPAIRGFILDLLGLNGLRQARIFNSWMPWPNHFSSREIPPPLRWGERLRLYSFLVVLIAGLQATNGWFVFLVLWVVPYSTVFVAVFRLRGIVEHLGTPAAHELNGARNMEPTWIERLTIAPLNVQYHLDHHLFPSVPQYNLPLLHKALLDNTNYRELACNQSGYVNLMLGDMLEGNAKIHGPAPSSE